MAELVVRDVEPALVARLKQRADEHHRTVEEEHKAILRGVLLVTGRQPASKKAQANVAAMRITRMRFPPEARYVLLYREVRRLRTP